MKYTEIQALLNWYSQNRRSLPWRETNNPYEIWLSEVILQQTRVDQGTPYYLRFVQAFPTIDDLATATEDEVLALWQGLGYYSRGRNLHQTAKKIVEMGRFPNSYSELISLKGIGPYTAAAVASFAFNEPVAVVDGNVFRVVSRWLANASPIDVANTRTFFFALLNEWIPPQRAADFNQAIMELGALVCVPKAPKCSQCPLSDTCSAHAQNTVLQFPVKRGRVKVEKVYHAYFEIQRKNKVAILRRPNNGIWAGLYDFPSMSSTSNITMNEINDTLEQLNISGSVQFVKSFTHVLSHRKIEASYYRILCETIQETKFQWSTVEQLETRGISALMKKYLNSQYMISE
jgi:A/G-specific adenine glycosylase